MKKKLLAVLLAAGMTLSLAACGGGNDTKGGSESESSNAGTEQSAETEKESSSEEAEASTEEAVADPSNGELVDGKFAETRKIVVEVYDRGNDGGSDPTNNMYTKYIQDGMMERYNVEVEFKGVSRWTEVEDINNLLAAGDAPDICVTYSYPTIQTYAAMGGVQDLSGYVEDYKELLPNLWDFLGETNIYWDKEPSTGALYAIEARRASTNRIATFVRRDWLEKLNIPEPTTRQEFEDMLIAFRDNAETLLGADADKMIPFSISYDVGWRAAAIIESFRDPDITDRENYINGFDDRGITQEGTKEAIRLLNKWYNDNLIWKDFALYGSGDTTEGDLQKSGYVGAFIGNWDDPFRNGEDSVQLNLERLVSPDAAYIAVDCFEDSKGGYTKYAYGSTDRKIFFPTTNDEPLASMLYLEFITTPEVIEYLQIGDEGVTHNKLEGGAVEVIAATGDAIQNSGFNLDYTITCNGLQLVDDEATKKSIAYSYSGIAPELIEKADKVANTDARSSKNVQVGTIEAEEGIGTALGEKRDIIYDNAVIAPVDSFDQVWDDGVADYLKSGGQAIMDERAEKWVATYGDVDMLPE